MACLLRSYDGTKGVVSFTTQEHLYLKNNPTYFQKLQFLKEKYYVGLHFNWHNYRYQPELGYDFLMAGEDDLIDLAGKKVKTLNMDACNFSPVSMDFGFNKKHWDILYVARGVFFKGIEHFFDSIRALYDSGKNYRVLFLCPAPPDAQAETKTLISLYESRFDQEERKLFNLVVLRENYPFFFDLPSLAHFYQSSKIFVHTADDERRCRVAAYAFCCGLPVVGMKGVGSILSSDARKSVFFEASNYEQFPSLVEKALNANFEVQDFAPARSELSEVFTSESLKKKLQAEFKEQPSFLNGHWFTRQLDIRLGRHHGFGRGTNGFTYNLENFMDLLLDSESVSKLNRSAQEDIESSVRLVVSREFNELPILFRITHELRIWASRVKNWIKNVFK